MAREGVVELYHQLYCTADELLFQSSLSSFPTHQHRHTSMERMRQADGDMKKKYDAERRHQLIRYRLLAAFAERLQPHGLGGQGEALPPLLLVALDSAVSLDLVGDPGLDDQVVKADTVRDRQLGDVKDQPLASHGGDDEFLVGSHDRLLSCFLAANAARSPSGGKLRAILYITRDEVSTAKEKHNNISLHQSRSHLVLTSACQ